MITIIKYFKPEDFIMKKQIFLFTISILMLSTTGLFGVVRRARKPSPAAVQAKSAEQKKTIKIKSILINALKRIREGNKEQAALKLNIEEMIARAKKLESENDTLKAKNKTLRRQLAERKTELSS